MLGSASVACSAEASVNGSELIRVSLAMSVAATLAARALLPASAAKLPASAAKAVHSAMDTAARPHGAKRLVIQQDTIRNLPAGRTSRLPRVSGHRNACLARSRYEPGVPGGTRETSILTPRFSPVVRRMRVLQAARRRGLRPRTSAFLLLLSSA